MLKTRVKVSGISNLSDARYCAGMGVDWLGFPMAELSVEKFTEIRNWLAGVEIVGEACGISAAEIIKMCGIFKPDVLEIDSTVHLEAIACIYIPKILRVNIDTDNLPALFVSAGPYVQQFLLVGNDQHSLSGMEASVEIWAAKYPILVGLEIPDEDLDEWIEQSSILGIGLMAGKEERPGFRDFTNLMSILEKLETE